MDAPRIPPDYPPAHPLANPTYYLANFELVLDWVAARYADLLDPAENAFVAAFHALPLASRALLVRMVMRKGDLFRASRLRYDEIGDTPIACAPLLALGWADDAPAFDVAALFSLFKKSELAARFPALADGANKADVLAQLLEDEAVNARQAQCRDWLPASGETIYRITVTALCDRFRLMFFGNCHQDWTEFVLSDLGVYRYEQVEFSSASRAFRSRRDIGDYLYLQQCRDRFNAGEALDDIVQALPDKPFANDWIEGRRAKLLFDIAQQYERCDDLPGALALYRNTGYRGARARTIRVLELLGATADACALAEHAAGAPESDAENQQVARMLPRLRRKLGAPTLPAVRPRAIDRHDLLLPRPDDMSVEEAVRQHLQAQAPDAPVFYVENALVNSLFGLLCWDAVFTPLPGAFFHRFHSGPADLHSLDFHARRRAQFDECIAQIDSGAYRQTIVDAWHAKAGIVSPFVYWDTLARDLLDLALDCIPAAHLRACCERMLADLRANRSGFPDLIQFWPGERRYRMIEVKGPGDRLQDNQLRWLDFCAEHAMPVSVCYVQWTDAP